MEIHHILVQLDDQPNHNDNRVRAAIKLAKQSNAQVTGCLIKNQLPDDIAHLLADKNPALTNVVKMTHEPITEPNDRVDEVAIKNRFIQVAKDTDPEIQTSFECHTGQIAEVLEQRIRNFDLLVMNHHPMEQGPLGHFYTLASGIAASSGKLVLMVPSTYDGENKTVGHRPLVAWSQNTKIDSVLEHTLPILSQAHKIKIILNDSDAKNDDNSQYFDRNQIQQAFSRFPVMPVIEEWHIGVQDYPDRLLSMSNEHDLIIMSPNNHSNLKDVLVGEATREMLRTSHIPVLLAV